MRYFSIQAQRLIQTNQPPAGHQPLLSNPQLLLPPLIGALHRSFAAWGAAGYSPGPITPPRVWISPAGTLAFAGVTQPPRLLQIGLAPDLAAWLVLLDKWMETFVVVARARNVWGVQELAAALIFLTPAFLPPALIQHTPDNWARVAAALARAVADGPLAGGSQDRHWRHA
jgi:hypothetical protein